MPHSPKQRAASIATAFQAEGRYSFTAREVLKKSGGSPIALRAAIRRLKAQHAIAQPRHGFYVVVPPEYRAAGAPPASWFIHDLAAFIRQPYYVGLLSAAALHGAAHQQPMRFQVVTDRPTRPVRIGRETIQFHVSRSVKATAVVHMQTETGALNVSNPEVTAFDLIRFVDACGHMSHVATVLTELAEKLKPLELVRVARHYVLPDAQRLGYLLEHLGERDLIGPLNKWVRSQQLRTVRLEPSGHRARHPSDRAWRVIPNVSLEVDL